MSLLGKSFFGSLCFVFGNIKDLVLENDFLKSVKGIGRQK